MLGYALKRLSRGKSLFIALFLSVALAVTLLRARRGIASRHPESFPQCPSRWSSWGRWQAFLNSHG